MQQRSGKKSSPLDDIRPQRWSFDDDLVALLRLIDKTVDMRPAMDAALKDVLKSELFMADDFPKPTEKDIGPVKTGKHSCKAAQSASAGNLFGRDFPNQGEADEEDQNLSENVCYHVGPTP
jgi:hypothetical protein